MNFRELLALPVKKSDKDANALLGHRNQHLEMADPLGQGWYEEWQNADRIVVNYLEDFCYDGRRTWTLGYVQFDGYTIMVFKNAGREGDDHYGSRVFDVSRFREMEYYLRDLIEIPEPEVAQTSLDADAGDFEEFYSDSIHTPFERHNY